MLHLELIGVGHGNAQGVIRASGSEGSAVQSFLGDCSALCRGVVGTGLKYGKNRLAPACIGLWVDL